MVSARDGKTLWVNPRSNPHSRSATLRPAARWRGVLFTGTAGGQLLAIDSPRGTVGWDGNVATPKGATELERIADVTSLPFVDEREVCAVAFQGRIACFELMRGMLQWSRDISSLTGIGEDERNYYVGDDEGSIHALDKSTGASVWKQERLAKRYVGGPQLVGKYVGVVDAQGYLHLLDPADGTLVGRVATDGTATSQPVRGGSTGSGRAPAGTSTQPPRRRPPGRRGASACCPPSPSSAARTSASRRCSTG